ncbi:MAG: PilZ domain-containing protein [Desulfobacterales bacterium]
MTQKVYVTSDQTITFTCPGCQQPRVVRVADHKELEKADKLRVTCRHCHHKYPVSIERRRQYRKPVDFPGSYTHYVNGKPMGRGAMRVVDLSRTGLKLKMNDKGGFGQGDKLQLQFYLDDANHSLIKKEVDVKKVFGTELGVAFTSSHPSDPSDQALGFYMFG